MGMPVQNDERFIKKGMSLQRWLSIAKLRISERLSASFRIAALFVLSAFIFTLVVRARGPSLKFSKLDKIRTTDTGLPQLVSGEKIYIVTHEMSGTGAPRVCTQLAGILSENGADVTLAVAKDALRKPYSFSSHADYFASRVVAMGVTPTFSLDVGASQAAAASADVVIVSTADARQHKWIEGFRKSNPGHKGLVWWVHEAQSVMEVFAPSTTASAIRIMTSPGLLNGLILPSRHTQAWWYNKIEAAGIPLLAGALPTMTRVIHWGLSTRQLHDIAMARQRVAEQRSVLLSARNELGISEDDFVFIVLASFHPLKGHSGVVKAVKLAQRSCGTGNVKLHLVAAGADKGLPGHFPQPGMEWVDDDASLHFLPPTSNVPALLAMGDAYVSNTKFGGETWGLATLEALAAGLPVLASGVGGSVEQLHHNVTALVHHILDDKDDSEAQQLSEHMCLVVVHDDLRLSLGTAGRTFVHEKLNQAHNERALVDALAGLLVR